MLISSPFLPTPVAGETKDQYLDRSMVVGTADDGGFPVSFEMNWHGGVHLSAPSGASQVRAIADGKVSFIRQPTARSTDPTHPLNYRGGWTDDGVIVVRHETDIGAIAALVRPASNKEQLTFTWRRQTQKEPVFDAQGNPVISRRTGRQVIGFMPGSFTVDFPLDHQKP